MVKYVSFDIETSGSIEKPDGITCAATMLVDGAKRYQHLLWHGQFEDDDYSDQKKYADKMPSYMCQELAEYLDVLCTRGYRPLAWNGVSFDFRVLAAMCDSAAHYKMCIKLAQECYDPGFQMVNRKGYMVKLSNAAIGLGVKGKLEGMDGHKAVEMWGENRESQETVLKYVAQDVIATANVWDAMLAGGCLRWLTRSGRISTWSPVGGFQPAKNFIDRPQNEAHWNAALKEVFKQEKFTAWMTIS